MTTGCFTDDNGRPYMVTTPAEFLAAREAVIAREPAAREMSYKELYPLALRELARVNGFDFDKLELESLKGVEKASTAPAIGNELARRTQQRDGGRDR